MRKLVILRRCSQLFFLGLFIYILWSTTYPLKGMISPQILFKLDPLIMFMTAFSERVLLPGFVFTLVMVAGTLILGRFFCGWVCPLGALLDGAGLLRSSKVTLNDTQNEKLRKPKFFLLGFIFLLAFLGIQVAWVFDPIVIVARVVSLNIIPAVTSAIDTVFIFFIRRFELYGPVYDFYRGLKNSFLGINIYFFANALLTLVFFFALCMASLLLARAWCRMFCPLGALYAFLARFAPFKRKVTRCTHCDICHRNCRMGAIKEDSQYIQGECILCMDCIYDCPLDETSFHFDIPKKKENLGQGKGNISRKNFLFLILSSLSLMGFRRFRSGKVIKPAVIRPPAALNENEFVDRCVRCGNCMKVCITNGLQPVILQSGMEGIWTPQLVPEVGYCEYNCTLCGSVCPTGAIKPLTIPEKHKTKLGLAKIDKSICLAWSKNQQCLVCEEHCPVASKAIKIIEEVVNGRRVGKPVVDESACIGCGICQNKCPARPTRAIRVFPLS